jgi:predicted transcriptional regulator
MVWARRSSIEIIGEILKLKRAGKTKIMYRANMSYEQMGMYLDFLENKGLMVEDTSNGRVIFKTTERGVNVLERIEGLLKELGLDEGLDEI